MNLNSIDGKKIAERIYARTRTRVALLSREPVLAIITCNPNFETKKYLALKERKVRELGISVRIIVVPEDGTTEQFITIVQTQAQDADGVIVQLPLPAHVDTNAILAAIPPDKDVDALGPIMTAMHSPVVGAIKEILLEASIDPVDKQVTIIGNGRLVGMPAYQWFLARGAHVSVVTRDTVDIGFYTRPADIIVSGAGVAGLIRPDMVREGVVMLDAGTSEDGGELRGDADPAIAEKAALFTPVPGGIGPVTIAILLENVVDCACRKQGVV